MKIITVIGARPQFIKAAAVSRKLRRVCDEIIIHTGQHYDNNLSDIFFKQLGIPEPDYNLNVGSGSHAKQTADMLCGIEEILLKEKPEYLLVYGDTNSTLSGALAASKIHIPVIHIEAGLRSFNMRMPEEQNRILTDHLSSLLFCSTDTSVNNLFNENIRENVFLSGDVMCDAVLHYSNNMKDSYLSEVISSLNGIYRKDNDIKRYYLATIHRAENTDDINKISEILGAFEKLDFPVIMPVHPRIRKMVDELNSEKNYKNIYFVEPVGYLEMLCLTKNAEKAVTDSGGLQKEAYILDTPCVTVREQTEWTETLDGNLNILAHPDEKDILDKILSTKIDFSKKKDHYGKGNAADIICDIINKHWSE